MTNTPQNTPIIRFLFLSFALLTVSACSMDQPSWQNTQRVEVHQDGFTDTFDTVQLNDGTLHAIANNYYRYGNGPMALAVSYDPQNKFNTSGRARAELARIAAGLREEGVKDLQTTTMAVDHSGEKSSTTVSFQALIAKPPQDCGLMPGFEGVPALPNSAQGEAPGYRNGCTIETLMAKQIARPGDLLGRPGFETNADGRRQEKVLGRGYYGLTPNAPIDGEQASGDAAE